jgi:parallel beta-helix repeat protein
VSNLSSLPGFDVNRHVVEGNHVHHCGLGGTGLGGINLGEGVGHHIINNDVHDNLGPGINLRFNPGPGSTGLTILANTVLNNQGEGIYISGAQTGTQVHSNCAHGNGGGDFVDLGVGTVVGQNLFGVDPLVVNAAAGDIHLTAGSPARGAGVGHAKIPTDFYGAPRPASGACDGGAAQFVG